MPTHQEPRNQSTKTSSSRGGGNRGGLPRRTLLLVSRSLLLVPRSLLSEMKNGSVIVDVAIDQGGCVETAKPTTHEEPTYVVDGVVHYCVTNMPGAVPRTSTFALCNATLPYIRRLADLGTEDALKDEGLAAGLNVRHGQIVHPVVANALGDLYT